MSVAASLIATTMNASTPLLLAALGILVAERSGVLNLGVEGIMLMAAIAGYMTTVAVSYTHLTLPTNSLV